ncbi:hypothetical protein CHLRE_09g402212v5 [Chlamydomonas reinhardtii]|uniref:Uncharacterized protein n=1 Tax=Chlamydomonas reinhardtii TaxID=3055 RepID=A0A2K3DCR0_CHLRE|nr:uncharacterized protein CHLRE_09g402212v5 [Chlamydomonas reinhardtii]PNW78318.1 hypothetical protein CHLRE_09g402212v5 [Chlamydomonas reinhardtii]
MFPGRQLFRTPKYQFLAHCCLGRRSMAHRLHFDRALAAAAAAAAAVAPRRQGTALGTAGAAAEAAG